MEEVVGPENMTPEARETVIDFLNNIPLAVQELKQGFFAWARQVGHTPTSKDAAAVGVRKKRKP